VGYDFRPPPPFLVVVPEQPLSTLSFLKSRSAGWGQVAVSLWCSSYCPPAKSRGLSFTAFPAVLRRVPSPPPDLSNVSSTPISTPGPICRRHSFGVSPPRLFLRYFRAAAFHPLFLRFVQCEVFSGFAAARDASQQLSSLAYGDLVCLASPPLCPPPRLMFPSFPMQSLVHSSRLNPPNATVKRLLF